MTIGLLAASFAVLLAGAVLFTNAVEWLGHRLALGQGAVGSLLAAVATALPESIIPVIAIVGGAAQSTDVAIGAIIGAPFMLATVAMALVGVSSLAFAGRRPQGRAITPHRATFRRDLFAFLVMFTLALALGLGAPRWLQIAGAIVLMIGYAAYVRRSIRDGGAIQDASTLAPLHFDPSRSDPPAFGIVVVQLVVALGAIIGGAHLFVEELLSLAEQVGVSALVLSLVLAPLATELPEKANSIFWMREGKDALALGNITGAMVFQASLPVSIGLVFTDWSLTAAPLLAGALALAGGTVAVAALSWRSRPGAAAILVWGSLFAGFVVYVSLVGG